MKFCSIQCHFIEYCEGLKFAIGDIGPANIQEFERKYERKKEKKITADGYKDIIHAY